MASSSSWKYLDLPIRSGPRLLVKYQFSTSGYSVQLTDLSRIWSEQLTKDDIVRQAADVGSAIDAGESDEQLLILLGKVESALNQDDGSTVNLYEASHDALNLIVTAPLPHPLPSFRWTVHLQRESEDAVETKLVTPLIQQATTLFGQIQHLIAELQDKDRVISKITDRLETSGNDLTTVFPGVSNIKISRKKSQREQLAKHVKGLSDFDEGAWRSKSALIRKDGGEVGLGALEEVLKNLYSPLESTGREQWWKCLKNESTRAPAGASQNRDDEKIPAVMREQSSIDEDFQRQTTPPNTRQNATHDLIDDDEGIAPDVTAARPPGQPESDASDPERMAGAISDDTTEDEEEDDLDAGLSKEPPTSSKSPPRKLGMLGGKPAQSSQPRSKLGTIGGRASPTSKDLSPSPRRRDAKGTIGQEAASTPSKTPTKAHKSDERKSRETSREPPSTEPRETSQERADRKRDQLKRELELKANAPAKKKRRF